MDFKLYLSMNSVALGMLFLCCLMIARCFSIKKYAMPFSLCAGLMVTILLESCMVSFLLIKVPTPNYIILPLYLLANTLSSYAGVLTFNQLVNQSFFKSQKSKLVIMAPTIVPLVVYIIELSLGKIAFDNFVNKISDFAPMSITATAIVSTCYIVLGVFILALSYKKLQGTIKRLIGYFVFSLGAALIFNLIPYVTSITMEFIWVPYAFALMFMLLCTLRLNITRDGLTLIKNRVGFERDIRNEVTYMRRKNNLYLIVADIDDFKNINDSNGHSYGDRALVVVAKALNEKAQEIRATPYRIGGDEFAIILPDHRRLDVEEFMIHVTEEIKMQVGNDITLSMGVCEYKKGTELKKFLDEADHKMYEQKRFRKNKQI